MLDRLKANKYNRSAQIVASWACCLSDVSTQPCKDKAEINRDPSANNLQRKVALISCATRFMHAGTKPWSSRHHWQKLVVHCKYSKSFGAAASKWRADWLVPMTNTTFAQTSRTSWPQARPCMPWWSSIESEGTRRHHHSSGAWRCHRYGAVRQSYDGAPVSHLLRNGT
jgi:hypothetical protein